MSRVKNSIRGSRKPKREFFRTHCKWCGKKLPKERSVSMSFCNTSHRNQYHTFSIRVLSPPDSWKQCQMKGCAEWFPIWNALGKAHMDKMCCCQVHSNKHSATKRGRIISQAVKGLSYKKKVKTKINRREQCFREEPFGLRKCDDYDRCQFRECTGYK